MSFTIDICVNVEAGSKDGNRGGKNVHCPSWLSSDTLLVIGKVEIYLCLVMSVQSDCSADEIKKVEMSGDKSEVQKRAECEHFHKLHASPHLHMSAL